ncbi:MULTISPECIES: hypothetical protein [Cysteiniphilum]|nr:MULTISPECIES: hypothetical protein [Cysteiniphilum]
MQEATIFKPFSQTVVVLKKMIEPKTKILYLEYINDYGGFNYLKINIDQLDPKEAAKLALKRNGEIL